MNRDQLKQDIPDERALAVFDILEAAVAKRDGEASDASLMLIADYCRAEMLKNMLNRDILERGVVNRVSNYRQSFSKPNPSVAQLRAVVEQQRKILAELRLTPVSNKAQQAPLDDDFDNFG